MNLFAKFVEALGSSRQQQAELVMRRYQHLVDQARAYEEKERLEVAGKHAAHASIPPFMAGTPLCSR